MVGKQEAAMRRAEYFRVRDLLDCELWDLWESQVSMLLVCVDWPVSNPSRRLLVWHVRMILRELMFRGVFLHI